MNDAGTHILASRVVDVPREVVFRRFTDLEHLSDWWGPRGFSTRNEVAELRPGGRWIHTMIGPDGVAYPNDVRFVEVDAPARLVYDHLSQPAFRATITFAAINNSRTEITFDMEFASKDLRDAVAGGGAIEGLEDTLDRFRESLTV